MDKLRNFVRPVDDAVDTLRDDVKFVIKDSWQHSTQEISLKLNYGQRRLHALSLDTQSNVPAAIDLTLKCYAELSQAERPYHQKPWQVHWQTVQGIGFGLGSLQHW